VATRHELLRFKGRERYVRAIAFSPDGRLLTWSGLDEFSRGVIHVWDVAHGREAGDIEAPLRAARAMAISPDAKTLAAGFEEEDLILYDLASGKERRRLRSGNQFHSALAFSPDGRTLAATGDRGIVAVWRAETGDVVSEFKSADNWAG